MNFRDVVPKVPGISADELKGKAIEYDGSEYLGSLAAVGRVTQELWRTFQRCKSVLSSQSDLPLSSVIHCALISVGHHCASSKMLYLLCLISSHAFFLAVQLLQEDLRSDAMSLLQCVMKSTQQLQLL